MNVRLSKMNLPRFPLLKDEEMTELLQKVQTGDGEAREKLINCNLRLVFSLVQRFSNRGYESEDLFQIGTIGLIKAIDKFDLSYNVKFSTYAVPMIIGEIRRFLRDDSPIKISRSLKENAYRINKKRETLTKQLGREPTLQEIAAKLDIPLEEIIISLEAMQMPTSIYETLYQDDGDPIYVLDQLSSETEDEMWFEKIAFKEILSKLPHKERDILIMRFIQDKTQTEIAKIIGLSQVQVSRLERQALKKFKYHLEKDVDETGT
ncbi:MAG TPA: RNA polymerase sporulation sigma factor SigF [Clostridia bacterium]|jgi:RNA polymerase sporulation-specific sigma factor|nr:RNA polymerase sporulation sigma factor SigF [Clostridia bacterium]HHY06074.1 RNA polymerase sporulation sigma factor SigF [Clostridia bacterium]